MAPKGSLKGKGKATARAKMPTSVINRHLSLDRDRIRGFILEHIRGLIWIYIVCGVKDERAWDFFNDINFLDPVTTHHISQFQLMWPHRRSRSLPFREWWVVLRSYMGHMFDKTCDQINNWRWDNPRAFGDQLDRSNPLPTAWERLNAPASISLATVAMISGQRLSHQAAGSTSQASSWPLDHWIGMR